MWSSVVIFSSFLVFSAHACDGPVKPKPDCVAPTFVNQSTDNTECGNMTMVTVDSETSKFICHRVHPNHNVIITIEYYHHHQNTSNHHTQQEVGTEIAVGASLTYICDPYHRMYVGSLGKNYLNVIRRLRCNSFDRKLKQDLIKKEMNETAMPEFR